MEVPEDKVAWKAEFDKMDVISKTLDSVVSLVGQASQRTSYCRKHLILKSLLSDHKKPKRCWMTGVLHRQTIRPRTCLVISLKKRFVEAPKLKPSWKMYSKVLNQAIDPFVGALCPVVVAEGIATDDLPLVSKVLTLPEVRNLFLPPAKNLPVLHNLSQVNPLVRSLFPEDLQCRYLLARRLKYFRKNWEKPSSNQTVLNMISGYKVPFSEVPPSKQIP